MKTTRQAQSAATTKRILEATLHSFAELGYERASMKVIAERAGVSRSLLHYHFASKEALMTEAIRHMGASITGELGARLAARGVPVVAEITEDVYELVVGHPVHAAFVLELFATANHNPALRSHWRSLRDEIRAHILAILGSVLAREVESEHLRIARLLETGILGLCMQAALQDEPDEMRRSFDELFRAVDRLISLHSASGVPV